MTHRERAMAILHRENYDRLPLVHFGYWGGHTLQEWAKQDHVTQEEAEAWSDGNAIDEEIGARLGFDFNWYSTFSPAARLRPGFKTELVKEFPDGRRHIRNANGVVLVDVPGTVSIQAEVDHLLKDRATWEEHYKHRYVWTEERVTHANVHRNGQVLRYDQGGLEILQKGEWDTPYGLACGSLAGQIRDVLGLENFSYLQVDDPDLFDEMIEAVSTLSYEATKMVLEAGGRFDFGHFWEDICFNGGPLMAPSTFKQKMGPAYRRTTELLAKHGIDIVSVDCDGDITSLVPTWLENGVNAMFPIEVGTWHGNIASLRDIYGDSLLGIGGVDKRVFAEDRAAVDGEVERLKPLVDLGGYLPCIDHRIPPDSKWDMVKYYCEKMREAFGG